MSEAGAETDLYSPMELEGFEQHPDDVSGRHLKNRLNVTACWKGRTDQNAVMLMAHSDTASIGTTSILNAAFF